MIAEAAQELGEHEVVPLLLEVIEAAFAITGPAWPTASETALTRLALGYVNPIGRGVEGIPANFGRGLGRPSLLDADLASATGAAAAGATPRHGAGGGVPKPGRVECHG